MSQRRISVLDTTVGLFPKLDVAGSNPVSRSMFSITWEEPKINRYSVFLLSPSQIAGILLNHLRFEAIHL